MKPISLHLIKFFYNGWQFDKLTMAALRNIMTKRKLIIYMKTEKKNLPWQNEESSFMYEGNRMHTLR